MAIHVFGVRHHGPGSSRNLLRSLSALKPDIVLIEGPPEGEAMLQWVTEHGMKPPVALLGFVPDNPQKAVIYPFAGYSPEWNALQYAYKNTIPVRFIDLPLSHTLAETNEDAEETADSEREEMQSRKRTNYFEYLAEIAGFDDEDEWWEHHFELHQNSDESFQAISYAVESLRDAFPVEDVQELRREAFMRKCIRNAQSENFETIAVVCGAWHVPALLKMPTKKADDELLKNLPKIKVDTTWIPWTNDRLLAESGYGAGVTSPGWYQHVWDYHDDDGARWLSRTAQVFRSHKVDISSAHIIEAVKLAQALSRLRNVSVPGLKELTEATQAVMCMGDSILLNILKKDLIIGAELGQIPDGAPRPPLYNDFEKRVKSLRLKAVNEEKIISLDLREPFDVQKSIFLHRLQILNVYWGKQLHVRGKGTFKEEWTLFWHPELIILLLEKASWGNTIESAAGHFLEHSAQSAGSLLEITTLAQKALPTELHNGIKAVMRRLDELAASTTDAIALVDAFIPLAQMYRYGTVRNTDRETIGIIVQSVFYRIISGLPFCTSNINEESAADIAQKIRQVHDSILLLDIVEYKEQWLATVSMIIGKQQTEAIIHGCCCKILYDQKIQSSTDIALLFSRAVSVIGNTRYAASWLEGFLAEGTSLLLFDDDLLTILDAWLMGLHDEDFLHILPLLRRTFSSATTAEKRKLAQKILSGGEPHAVTSSSSVSFDTERAQKVLPIFETLLLR